MLHYWRSGLKDSQATIRYSRFFIASCLTSWAVSQTAEDWVVNNSNLRLFNIKHTTFKPLSVCRLINLIRTFDFLKAANIRDLTYMGCTLVKVANMTSVRLFTLFTKIVWTLTARRRYANTALVRSGYCSALVAFRPPLLAGLTCLHHHQHHNCIVLYVQKTKQQSSSRIALLIICRWLRRYCSNKLLSCTELDLATTFCGSQILLQAKLLKLRNSPGFILLHSLAILLTNAKWKFLQSCG